MHPLRVKQRGPSTCAAASLQAALGATLLQRTMPSASCAAAMLLRGEAAAGPSGGACANVSTHLEWLLPLHGTLTTNQPAITQLTSHGQVHSGTCTSCQQQSDTVRHARRSLSLPATGTGNVTRSNSGTTTIPKRQQAAVAAAAACAKKPSTIPNDDAHHSPACPQPKRAPPSSRQLYSHHAAAQHTTHPAWQHHSTAMARCQAGSATKYDHHTTTSDTTAST